MSSFERFPSWIDGRLFAPGEGCVSSDDQGLLSGLSVFETVLREAGTAWFLDRHLARLEQGAAGLCIARRFDPQRAVEEYCAALGQRDCALRLTLTRGVPEAGSTLVIGARAIVRPPDPGVRVTLERDAKDAHDPLESYKSTNRLRNVLLRERALAAGAFEALMLTKDGDVCEGTLSNVWAVVDGVVCTPSTQRGCLAGVMRGVILEELERGCLAQRVERLELRDLERASEVFLSNTTGRVLPVIEIAGLVAGLPGSHGPVLRDLRERIAAAEAHWLAAR
ncbi:MAG: aminotransferase class IV [Planctomycetes bacterium]|nr:aminotransferase class IV [Planctomycetota bacterium]